MNDLNHFFGLCFTLRIINLMYSRLKVPYTYTEGRTRAIERSEYDLMASKLWLVNNHLNYLETSNHPKHTSRGDFIHSSTTLNFLRKILFYALFLPCDEKYAQGHCGRSLTLVLD